MSSTDKESSNSVSSSSSHWWKAIVEVSALFAVVAGTVYVVGLFALWVPLATQITHDFSTSWYAVSLIPQVTVVGQGIRTLLGWPVLLVLLFVTVPFLVSVGVSRITFLRKLIQRSDRFLLGRGLGRPDYDSYTEWFKWYGGFLRGHIYSIGLCGLALPLFLGWSWFSYAALGVMFIGSGIAADFMVRSLEHHHEGVPSIRSRKWFLRGLVVLYIVVVSQFLHIFCR